MVTEFNALPDTATLGNLMYLERPGTPTTTTRSNPPGEAAQRYVSSLPLLRFTFGETKMIQIRNNAPSKQRTLLLDRLEQRTLFSAAAFVEPALADVDLGSAVDPLARGAMSGL